TRNPAIGADWPRLHVGTSGGSGRFERIDIEKSPNSAPLRVAPLEADMLDHRNGNGHSNGHNSGLVVEDMQNLTFQVHRKVFVSPEILEDENGAIYDRGWVCGAHASEVKNPGYFRTRHVAGRP